MKIIISPAKKMNIDTDTFEASGTPVFSEKTEILRKYLSERSYGELKNIWKCNEKLAELNYERIRSMDISGRGLTPAVVSYEGIQYQYLSPKTLETGAIAYLEEKLRILSGFYGVLKPMDGVTPYRLEMQSELAPPLLFSEEGPQGETREREIKSLYSFWGDLIYKEIFGKDAENHGPCGAGETVINLASKEYSKAVEPYLSPCDNFITCAFCELKDGRLKTKATMAKTARGEMARFMAENRIENTEDIKSFSRLGFSYEKEYSDEKTYVFVKRL